MENWPNFFVVGAPKAGTTSLYQYLRQIPGIYMSPVKEPNYFCQKQIPENHPYLRPIRKKNEYLSLFNGVKNEKIVGESSPRYLADLEVPKIIQQLVPKALIIASLRDPIERAFSHYLMHVQSGGLELSFHEELKKELEQGIQKNKANIELQQGLYSDSVKRYLDNFGSNQVKIIIFEEWIKNPKKTMEEILKFLRLEDINIDSNFIPSNQYIGMPSEYTRKLISNKSINLVSKRILTRSTRKFLREKFLLKKQPKPEMELEDRKLLVEYYKNDVEQLQNLLGTKLPWMNFQNKNQHSFSNIEERKNF